MYHSQHRPKSNRISRLFRCDFPAMRLHGGFDDGQADSGSLHRDRMRFIRAIEPLEQPGSIYMLRCVHCIGDSNLNLFPPDALSDWFLRPPANIPTRYLAAATPSAGTLYDCRWQSNHPWYPAYTACLLLDCWWYFSLIQKCFLYSFQCFISLFAI